ncbi:MAG: hypothetical protein ACPHQP_08215 [Longimicrobiales bacterium]
MSESFHSRSVVLPTLGETASLTHTVECLVADLRDDLAQILIIVCEKSRKHFE